jgi:hypothetical protein
MTAGAHVSTPTAAGTQACAGVGSGCHKRRPLKVALDVAGIVIAPAIHAIAENSAPLVAATESDPGRTRSGPNVAALDAGISTDAATSADAENAAPDVAGIAAAPAAINAA